MTITIIIPTYKSSSTIAACLDSVLKQTFIDFECLVIDYPEDFSTQKIVESYKKKDNRIKYIVSSNKGAMAQREYGIRNASGNYLCFIDSDDFVHEKYVELLYTSLTKSRADFSFGKIMEYNDVQSAINDYHEVINYKITIYQNNNYKKILNNFRKRMTSTTPVCLLAKKEFFLKMCNYYNSSLNIVYYEDAIFGFYLWYNSKSVAIIDSQTLYFYIGYKHQRKTDMVKFYSDCYMVSKVVKKVISNSAFPKYTNQCSYYSVIASIFKLFNKNIIRKKDFIEIRKTLSSYVGYNDISIFHSDYHFSEALIATALKYNIFLLVRLVIVRRKLLKNTH